MRILVTGSRDWTDKHTIAKAITDAVRDSVPHPPTATLLTGGVVVVHGACPTGADALADDWCKANFIEVEQHPADWRIGKHAGFQRNAEMVRSGVDICLAFIKNESKGASMTAKLAEQVGVPTRRFTL